MAKPHPRRPRKLLILSDDPAGHSGFGRVARNIIRRLHVADIFTDIWVWGIGYHGWPHELPCKICPAEPCGGSWRESGNIRAFLTLLKEDFTHVWMLQDTFAIADWAREFATICERRRIASALYFPVDAPMDVAWTRAIAAVDVPVAYCDYGLAEARAALAQPLPGPEAPVDPEEKTKPMTLLEMFYWSRARPRAAQRLRTIPHGVDTEIYRPLAEAERTRLRRKIFEGQIGERDFLILNVSAHQRRKGLAQTLQTFKQLQTLLPERSLKLYLHMPRRNQGQGTDLGVLARQLGLAEDAVVFGDRFFQRDRAPLTELQLNEIYNCADLFLTTTYGEGWGLPLTEAMAAGVPVAGPRHTSVAELLTGERGLLFETEGHDTIEHDNNRWRPRSNPVDAAAKIAHAMTAAPDAPDSLQAFAQCGTAWARGDFLNWDRIVREWIEVFFGR